MDGNVIMILGMHRSGTSLIASWLHQCGLTMGSDFVTTDVGNVKGYFEDEDFVKFHKKLLRSNKTKHDIISCKEELKYSKSDLEEARSLFSSKNNQFNNWAWKDPRTCLFLKMWHDVIPKSKVLFVFRDYNEVVDSLIRRKAKAEKKRRNIFLGYFNLLTKSKYKKKKHTSMLLRSWIKHNEAVLDYINNYKKTNEFFCINSKDLFKNAKMICDSMNEKFNIDLKYSPIEKIFDRRLMHIEAPSYNYDEAIEKEAKLLLIKLNSQATEFTSDVFQ